MRKSLLFAGLILVASNIAYFTPKNGASASQSASQAPGKIGPFAVWQPSKDFITKARTACDKSNRPSYAECFIDQMFRAGAPTDAVSFTRLLDRQSDGQVGIMTDFHKVGLVDVARVVYLLRANDNYGLLLVNGDPAILDVDDLKKLDRTAMEQNPMYQAVKQKYTGTDIWAGDRSGTTWPQVKPLPEGGQQFIISYPLINGCHACARTGLALFSWNFDAKGKFLGTKYIPTPPPPKLMHPNRVPRPPTEPQQPQQQTQPPPQ